VKALLALAALSLAACATAGRPPQAMSGFQLNATSWIQRDGEIPNGVRHPTITFDGHSARGFTGCNEWFAHVASNEGGNLRFTQIGSTKRACDEAAMDMERLFLAGITRTLAAEYDAQTLTLRLIGDEADHVGLFDAVQPPGARRD
jgi:heat shock protein HslJ